MKNYYTKGEENIYRVTIQVPAELHRRISQFANCYRGSDAETYQRQRAKLSDTRYAIALMIGKTTICISRR